MQIPESNRPKEFNSKCHICERHFTCDITNGCASCWCMTLPAVLPVSEDTKCLCQECLEKIIGRSELRCEVVVPAPEVLRRG